MWPDKGYSIWESTEGDINGDGIADIALVITAGRELGPREERLAVLAGRPDGQYRLLSISGDYCQARKFYNLDIRRGGLFVQGVNSVDANSVESVTLQFRYDAKLDDLLLIGREEETQSQIRRYRYTVSVNYLNQTMIHTRRDGRRQREVKRTHALLVPRRLHGYDCQAMWDTEPRLYIEDDFSIRE